MAVSRCRVSWIDADHIEHSAEVDAETLYEAVALAVAEFRDDEVNSSEPGAMTEFTVQVFRRPTEHKLRLNQLQRWAAQKTMDGPAGILKRQRVRTLLRLRE